VAGRGVNLPALPHASEVGGGCVSATAGRSAAPALLHPGVGGGAPFRYVLRPLMQVAALDLRPGYLVSYEGRMCSVVWWNILRNDRRLFVQMRIKDIQSGRVQELKEHGDTKYEVLDKEEVELTHSYRDGTDEVFFSPEGEEVRCSVAGAEDALKWQAESYVGLFVNGQLVFVRPPASVVLTVKDTTPPIKGAGTGLKDAVLENGMKVRVGNLVDVGNKVRIDTETGEFKERVQG
jgi:elongation factor P